jgi:hypothetical protein
MQKLNTSICTIQGHSTGEEGLFKQKPMNEVERWTLGATAQRRRRGTKEKQPTRRALSATARRGVGDDEEDGVCKEKQ